MSKVIIFTSKTNEKTYTIFFNWSRLLNTVVKEKYKTKVLYIYIRFINVATARKSTSNGFCCSYLHLRTYFVFDVALVRNVRVVRVLYKSRVIHIDTTNRRVLPIA